MESTRTLNASSYLLAMLAAVLMVSSGFAQIITGTLSPDGDNLENFGVVEAVNFYNSSDAATAENFTINGDVFTSIEAPLFQESTTVGNSGFTFSSDGEDGQRTGLPTTAVVYPLANCALTYPSPATLTLNNLDPDSTYSLQLVFSQSPFDTYGNRTCTVTDGLSSALVTLVAGGDPIFATVTFSTLQDTSHSVTLTYDGTVYYAAELCGFVLAKVNGTCPDLKYTPFHQGGDPGVSKYFGYRKPPGAAQGSDLTESYGCTLCSTASMLSAVPGLTNTTPTGLDVLLASANGYDASSKLSFPAIKRATSGAVTFEPTSPVLTASADSHDELDDFLHQNYCVGRQLIILQLFEAQTDTSTTPPTVLSPLPGQTPKTHYVLLIGGDEGDWKVWDPGWKSATPTGNANTLNGHFSGFSTVSARNGHTIFHQFTVGDVRMFDPGMAGFLTVPAASANQQASHGVVSNDATPDNPTTQLAISSSSAVELQLTDALGNQLGYDPDSGANLYAITDGSYFSDAAPANPDGEDPLNPGDTSVQNTLYVSTAPAGGVYQLTILATADGAYSVDVVITGPGNGAKTLTLTGFLTAGQQATSEIDIPDLPASGTDLAVTGGVSPTQGAQAGGTLSYSFQVTNQGLAAATSVTLFDQLSDGATVVSASGSDPAVSFTYSNSAVLCNLPDMAPGATETINITAIALTSGTLTNVATASAFETDVAPANNTATTTTTITDAPTPSPVISSAHYDSVQAGQMYSYQVTATNSPTSYGVSGLPDGLTIDPTTGLISGTQGVPGVFAVNISAINASGTGTATLVLTVVADPTVPIPDITGAADESAQINLPFSYQIAASNTPTFYTASGLPPGLSVDAAGGLISGTPTAAGIFTVGLSAANAGGAGTGALTLTVSPAPIQAPAVTSGSATVQVNTSFNYQIIGTNSPVNFGASNLPGGLSVSASGLISGAPTQTGTFTIGLSATNAGGTGTGALVLTVLSAPVQAPVITSLLVATARQGAAFTYQIAASNSPSSFGATGLPAGLSIDQGTGIISGTPSVAGVFSVNVSATNAGGTGTAILSLTVANAVPVVNLSTSTPKITVGDGATGAFLVDRTGSNLSQDIVVSYTVKGNAIPGVDYERLKGTVKLKAGKASKPIKVVPLGDLGGATKKTIKITLASGSGYTLGTTAPVKIKLIAPGN